MVHTDEGRGCAGLRAPHGSQARGLVQRLNLQQNDVVFRHGECVCVCVCVWRREGDDNLILSSCALSFFLCL